MKNNRGTSPIIPPIIPVLAEGKRRFVALPLDNWWFGNLVGSIIGFILFASVLKFDPQKLLDFGYLTYLLLLCVAFLGVLVLVLMAYKAWQGDRFDPNNLFMRIHGFFVNLAACGIVLGAVFYDVIVLIFFRG